MTDSKSKATPEDILSNLVQTGSLIDDCRHPGMFGLPIHAELITLSSGRRYLYWVDAGAEDQHHTHAREFDSYVVRHERDLDLSLCGTRVAYIAPFAEWEENAAQCAQWLREAKAALADTNARANFDRFTADCAPREYV